VQEAIVSETTWDNQTLYAACADHGSERQVAAYEMLWAYLHGVAYWMVRERPDPDAFAADCAQIALLKIHQNLDRCQEPAAFRAWAARIVRRTVLDELRRPDHARRASLPDDEEQDDWFGSVPPIPEPVDLRGLLLAAIEHGPLSDRSRRVVVGKFLDDVPDEMLARTESELAAQAVLPSHVQVTRAKNLASLRRDPVFVERVRDLLD
jgi:RNA polymerase sigma factor (sigma-70 family)